MRIVTVNILIEQCPLIANIDVTMLAAQRQIYKRSNSLSVMFLCVFKKCQPRLTPEKTSLRKCTFFLVERTSKNACTPLNASSANDDKQVDLDTCFSVYNAGLRIYRISQENESRSIEVRCHFK